MGCNNNWSGCNQCGGGSGNPTNRRGCRALANEVERLICEIKKDTEALARAFDALEDRGCIRNESESNNGGSNGSHHCHCCHCCHRCNRSNRRNF